MQKKKIISDEQTSSKNQLFLMIFFEWTKRRDLKLLNNILMQAKIFAKLWQ